MSGFCSAHQHHEPGCLQCEAMSSKNESQQQRDGLYADHVRAAISALDMRNAYRGPMAPERAVLVALAERLERLSVETCGEQEPCVSHLAMKEYEEVLIAIGRAPDLHTAQRIAREAYAGSSEKSNCDPSSASPATSRPLEPPSSNGSAGEADPFSDLPVEQS